MPEIKSTPPDKQLADAIAAIRASTEEARRRLDRQAEDAIRELNEARDAHDAVAATGLLEKAQHVFVAHFDPRGHGHRFFDVLDVNAPMANYRIQMTSHYQHDSVLPGPRDCAYRVWLIFEPLEEKP